MDTAHIHQFADSRNNDPCNGIALCKNAHWLFDQGLWTISDDYMVIVATGQFAEQSPDHKGLRDYHGQRVRLPSDPTLRPKMIYLSWHRKNKFQGRWESSPYQSQESENNSLCYRLMRAASVPQTPALRAVDQRHGDASWP